MGKYFGTDGFRGEAGVGLTAEHAFKIGRFLGWYYGQLKRLTRQLHPGDDEPCRARIVLGKDTRRSSYMLEYALASGIAASGGDAYTMHVTTTPSVAYVARTEDFDCGVMVSASHNPYYDNGIKLMDGNGEKAGDDLIALVEAYLDGEVDCLGFKGSELPWATGAEVGAVEDHFAGRNRYVGFLISQGIFSLRGKRIGLDCANGASWSIARSVFESMGAKVYTIGCEPDGTNINAGVGSTHIEALQELVRAEGLDCGFAYDGDADRCLAVDEHGNLIDGDKIMYICARYMKDKGHLVPNEVTTTVMSNLGLYKALDEAGIQYAQTQVGDRYVWEHMRASGGRIGGEQSGHIIFGKLATTGDGILTSIKLMEAVMGRKSTLGELAAPVHTYPQVLINVRVSDKKAAMADPDVVAAAASVESALAGDGRALVRASGTEPLVRVMVEAATDEIAREQAQRVVDVIREKGWATE